MNFGPFKKIMFSLAALLLAFQMQAQEAASTQRNIKALKDFTYKDSVVYKTVNGENLAMLLIMPKVKKYAKTPVMLYTHGGGWGKGDRYVILTPLFFETVKILAENGIACASIEYRLTRRDTSVAYDCVVDCKDAGRWLVKNAGLYNLDVNRIGVWGGSAGGHLSLMTAMGNPKDFAGDNSLTGFDPAYKCVASYFPLTTFLVPDVLEGSNFSSPQRFVPMFGGLLKDKGEMAKLLSPVEYLSQKTLPILLMHGDADKVLNIKNSLYMKRVADEKGAPVELLVVKGAGHGFQGDGISPTRSEVGKIAADYIMNHLLKKE